MKRKFRKNPIVIEAEQWFPGVLIEGVNNITDHPSPYPKRYERDMQGIWTEPYACVDTLEGKMKVSSGDWIIKGINGELYPCKPDIFEKTYEEVQES